MERIASPATGRAGRKRSAGMTKTTPLPKVDIWQVLPELDTQTAVTIRLHPRRGEVPDLSASKMGGTFLWPEDDPWPTEPYFPPMEYVPVLQINSKDIPEFPFPPGQDLMQMLWLPDTDWESVHLCPPRFYWRDSQTIRSPLSKIPASPGVPGLIAK